MTSTWNFLSLGFEQGQSLKGLRFSADRVRTRFAEFQRLGLSFQDQGDYSLPQKEIVPRVFSEAEFSRLEWSVYHQAFEKIRRLLQMGRPLLNWGGDHSVAIATVGAFQQVHPEGMVLWIDAHADLNHPAASPSGHFHGMPLSVLLNLENMGRRWLPADDYFLDPSRLIYLGLRDLDPFEKDTIQELGITAYRMSEIQTRGLRPILKEIQDKIRGRDLHVSFDIDSVDPRFAAATGVPVPGGLLPSELDQIGLAVRESQALLRSADLVEINPLIGRRDEVERTYQMAFRFLKALALGRVSSPLRPTMSLWDRAQDVSFSSKGP